MFTTSETTAAISPAYVKAWASLENVKKESVNPHFKSRYANLASVLDAVRPVLASHGLAILQPMAETTSGVCILTRLVHESGEWMESSVTFPTADTKAQTLGAVTSYARRYALQAFLGISSDDDDGEAQRQAPAKAAPAATPIAEVDFTHANQAAKAALPKSEAQAVDVEKAIGALLVMAQGASTQEALKKVRGEVEALKKLRPDAEKHPLFENLRVAYKLAVDAAKAQSNQNSG